MAELDGVLSELDGAAGDDTGAHGNTTTTSDSNSGQAHESSTPTGNSDSAPDQNGSSTEQESNSNRQSETNSQTDVGSHNQDGEASNRSNWGSDVGTVGSRPNSTGQSQAPSYGYDQEDEGGSRTASNARVSANGDTGVSPGGARNDSQNPTAASSSRVGSSLSNMRSRVSRLTSRLSRPTDTSSQPMGPTRYRALGSITHPGSSLSWLTLRLGHPSRYQGGTDNAPTAPYTHENHTELNAMSRSIRAEQRAFSYRNAGIPNPYLEDAENRVSQHMADRRVPNSQEQAQLSDLRDRASRLQPDNSTRPLSMADQVRMNATRNSLLDARQQHMLNEGVDEPSLAELTRRIRSQHARLYSTTPAEEAENERLSRIGHASVANSIRGAQERAEQQALESNPPPEYPPPEYPDDTDAVHQPDEADYDDSGVRDYGSDEDASRDAESEEGESDGNDTEPESDPPSYEGNL
jgi:hypothetical protein